MVEKKFSQIEGQNGKVQADLVGEERIFSREDTKALIKLADKASNPNGLLALGKFTFDTVKKQQKAPPEYT